MNAQIKTYREVFDAHASRFAASFEQARNVKLTADRTVNGYIIRSVDGARLAVIETTKPHPRVEELLKQYTDAGVFTARELMRTLLNEEDYRSDIYDVIVRVYYREELT